jgi:U4/U6 small nuclear ribonucleoprotein PRP4
LPLPLPSSSDRRRRRRSSARARVSPRRTLSLSSLSHPNTKPNLKNNNKNTKQTARRDAAQQDQVLREFELRRAARQVVVPTDDGRVRAMLRQLQLPVTLFGEREIDRRDRLRRHIAENGGTVDAAVAAAGALLMVGGVVVGGGGAAGAGPGAARGGAAGAAAGAEAEQQTEVFYTEGPPELREARLAIARWSLPRAGARLRAAKRVRADVGGALARVRAARCCSEDAARRMAQACSEIADDRPVSGARFTADGAALATCGWGGQAAIWRVAAEPGEDDEDDADRLLRSGGGGGGGKGAAAETAAAVATTGLTRARGWQAHADRATDVAWWPGITGEAALAQAAETGAAAAGTAGAGADMEEDRGGGPSTLALATGGAEGAACLWSARGDLLRRLEGHTDRLARLSFHPSGALLATASFDGCWRLWDSETGSCLLEQEGHSRAVYCVAMNHPDGSLACSVGLDAHARLWDLRTGRCVSVLKGHVAQALSADFCPDGYRLATGSGDHTARVWDLRAKGCAAVIPAHRALVSAVRWHPGAWPAAGGGGFGGGGGGGLGGHYLLTAGYDCVAKLWSGRDYGLLSTLGGHEGRIMAADLVPGGGGGGGGGGSGGVGSGSAGRVRHLVATAAYDRTVKLWRPEPEDEEEEEEEEDGFDGDSGGMEI